MNINDRCIKELVYLAGKGEASAIQELMTEFNVSERTIRNDLNQIEAYLRKLNLGSIVRDYGKGYSLQATLEQRTELFDLHNMVSPTEQFVSKEERRKIILFELLNTDEPITSMYLQYKLQVSKGTIQKEITDIDEWLNNYDLRLISKPNYGYKVEGSETAKRNAILGLAKDFVSTDQILKMLSTQNGSDYQNLFTIDHKVLELAIHQLEAFMGQKLGDYAFASLFTHLAIAIQRIEMGKTIFLPSEDLILLEKTEAFDIAVKFSELLEEQFKIKIPKSEIGYITLHILASQLKGEKGGLTEVGLQSPKLMKASELLFEGDEYDYVEMATDITKHIKSQLNVTFQNEKDLIFDLSIHLKPAIHRCKYKMYLTNPLLDDIKKNYYRIFKILKETFVLLKIKYPIDMDDNELSYITLHFAAEIEKGKVDFSEKINALLVCASGIGTAKMLQSRIQTNFSDINVVDSISYLDFMKQTDISADLIISTISFEHPNHTVIVVNPLLTNEDIGRLDTFVYQTQKKHKLKEESQPITISKEDSVISLANILTSDLVELNIEANDWKDAIKKAANQLLKQNYITEEYINILVQNVKDFGPYIVIAPGIAFAHASHTSGVHKLGMSLTRLKNAVPFNHELNDPVKLIFTLAPSDKSSHYSALTDLMDILLDPRKMNILTNSNSITDIVNCLKK